ncbi:MAG: LCP family protein, partial [Cellulomonas sp.]
TFMTVPFTSYNPDSNQVVWTPAASAVWANMAADEPVAPITGTTESPATGATSSGGSAAPMTAETKNPGKEAFTPDDITAVCG